MYKTMKPILTLSGAIICCSLVLFSTNITRQLPIYGGVDMLDINMSYVRIMTPQPDVTADIAMSLSPTLIDSVVRYYKYIIDNKTEIHIHGSNYSLCNTSDAKKYRKAHTFLFPDREWYFQKFADALPSARTLFFEEFASEIMNDTQYPSTSNNCSCLISKARRISIDHVDCVEDLTSNVIKMTQHDMTDWFPPNFTVQHDTGKVKVTYLHLIPDAKINHKGDVTHHNIKVIPRRCPLPRVMGEMYRCSPLTDPTMYNEVFTIAQGWGGGFFHGAVEDLPRIALYLPYLRSNPHIMIHVVLVHPFFHLLGLDSSRFITGTVRARLVYMPAGTFCGRLHAISGHLASKTLQAVAQYSISSIPSRTHNSYTEETLPQTQNTPVKTSKESGPRQDTPVKTSRETGPRQDTIILIQRSKKRWFSEHDSILVMLQTHAQRFGLNVIVFSDKHLPNIEDTRDMFHRALVVIGPHGAGFCNLLFCQKGTAVIEGLCHYLELYTLCYKRLAGILQLRYHGLAFTKDCKQITADDVEKPFLQYLRLFGYNS